MKKEVKTSLVFDELIEHAPFTALATVIAVVLVGLFYYLNPAKAVSYVSSLFYVLHPAHILVSAIASAGIYYKYQKNIIGALLIGIVGSVVIGSFSDVIFPWLGGLVFGLDTSFHLELIEKPLIILGAGLIGSLLGVYGRFREVPHFLHVFLSVFASLFYLLAFSLNLSFFALIGIFVIVLIAVIIPCCLSDIAFPLWFVRKKK